MFSDQQILFNDNHLLAINKLPGIVCQPSKEHKDNIEDQAKLWVKDHYNKLGAVFLHVVHRLDKPVSGIVVMARTDKALSRMMAAVRERQVSKTYLAVVAGDLPNEHGEFSDWLLHDDFQSKIVNKDFPQSHFSTLKYQVIARINHFSLVKIFLETGRYHQIRIQFASRGFPIIGDDKYGRPFENVKNMIALHHYQFEFIHPVKKEPVILQALPPLHLPIWQPISSIAPSIFNK